MSAGIQLWFGKGGIKRGWVSEEFIRGTVHPNMQWRTHSTARRCTLPQPTQQAFDPMQGRLGSVGTPGEQHHGAPAVGIPVKVVPHFHALLGVPVLVIELDGVLWGGTRRGNFIMGSNFTVQMSCDGEQQSGKQFADSGVASMWVGEATATQPGLHLPGPSLMQGRSALLYHAPRCNPGAAPWSTPSPAGTPSCRWPGAASRRRRRGRHSSWRSGRSCRHQR